MVQELGYHLEVPNNEVESALYDHRFINEAGYKVLRIFRDRMSSPEEVRQKLVEALFKSDMGQVVDDVLGRGQNRLH